MLNMSDKILMAYVKLI